MTHLERLQKEFLDVQYLGDGAYVGRDRTIAGQIWIFTSNGIGITNRVALGPGELDRLSDYVVS